MESSCSRDASVSWLSGVARGVFLAKCKDTGTTPVASRQQRFLAMVLRHCCISQQQQRFAIVDKELGPLATAQVASALATDERYVSLNLAGNPGLDDGASALAKMLRSNTTLTEVDLRSNCVGPAGAVALFAALAEANRTLTSLDLSGMSGINRNRIGQRGAAAIAQMLAANQVLWRLCLQENGLGVEGIQALAPGLSANTSLAVLNLASNALGLGGAAALAKAIPFSHITHLILSRNSIGDSGLAAITESLHLTNSIEHIDLSTNDLGAKSGKLLGDVLRLPTCGIVSIDMSDNELGDVGLRLMSDALKDTHTLRELRLSRNRITAKGMHDFAAGLQHNHTLTMLDLSGNKIGDDGLIALCEPLMLRSCAVSKLILEAAFIGDAGASALARVLLDSPTLVHIDIRNNLIMDAAAEQLASAMEDNFTVLHLDVGLNDFNYRYFEAIERRIAANRKRRKEGFIGRLEDQMVAISGDVEELRRVQAELEDANAERARVEAVMEDTLRALEVAEEEARVDLRSWHDRLMDSTLELNRCELQKAELEKAGVAAKADKDHRYRSLIARLHHERELRSRLEHRVLLAKRDAADMLARHDRERIELEAARNMALADRENANKDVQELRQLMSRFQPAASQPATPGSGRARTKTTAPSTTTAAAAAAASSAQTSPSAGTARVFKVHAPSAAASAAIAATSSRHGSPAGTARSSTSSQKLALHAPSAAVSSALSKQRK